AGSMRLRTAPSTAAAPAGIYPLSLHDALPIWRPPGRVDLLHGPAPNRDEARAERLVALDLRGERRRERRRRHRGGARRGGRAPRSEEHTSELQSRSDLVCRLLLEKKKSNNTIL